MLAIVKADGRKIPLRDESVQMVCTSPPYWGLRKYAGEQDLIWGGRESCEHDFTNDSYQRRSNDSGETVKQLSNQGANKRDEPIYHGTCFHCGAWRGAYGLEPTVEMYVQHTVEILREIRRVLRDDGVVFWNVGDSYAGSWGNYGARDGKQRALRKERFPRDAWESHNGRPPMAGNDIGAGLKPKDLCLIPFRVALAAQADGWWVRSDIIWAKPNPMPESVTDRPARSHEYILMLTKSAKYYWDAEALREPARFGYSKWPEGALEHYKRSVGNSEKQPARGASTPEKGDGSGGRNLRSVWTLPTQPFRAEQCLSCKTVYDSGAFNRLGRHDEKAVCICGSSSWVSHFATFPEELPKRCILAATRLNDLVLDPFAGSGTVGKVAIELGRRAILCDLAYQNLASKRTAAIQRPLIAPGEAGWRE